MSIPLGITSINEGVFQGCSSLSNIFIPSNITSIGDFTFNKCSSLTSVVIPPNVTSIGKCAFNECKSLMSVIYLGNKNPEYSYDSFMSCKSLEFMCTPPNYESSEFCGMNNFVKADSCNELFLLDNKCYEIVVDENNIASLQYKYNEVSSCYAVECDNITGAVISDNCEDNKVCMKDKCVEESDITGKEWKVEILLNNSDMNIIVANDIAEEISIEVGISMGYCSSGKI